MNSETHLDQFIVLWDLVQQVQLTDEEDGIRWNLAASGNR